MKSAVESPFPSVDQAGFLEELNELRREVEDALGPEDLRHLQKIERWGRAATAVGLLTAGIAPNPLSAVCLSLGRSTRWLLMHHVGHRGYDKVPEVPARYTSRGFARGWRRFVDWLDWMLPEAWIYEHNVLHHSHTGEERDPDLIERNAEALRGSGLPRGLRYAALGVLGANWRSFYYAPNTLRAWMRRHDPPGAPSEEAPEGYARALWLRCYLPYAALHFGAMPLAFLPFGPWSAASALANSLLAEVLTNLHTFLVVGPNHTGDDLFRFSDPPRSKAERMVRQVIGSTNYATGGDLLDFAHLWLNYQIEHHLWPDLPMLRYQQLQPRVKALCEKYGIPYVQESVWARFAKMAKVAVGDASMKRAVRSAPA